MARDLGSARRRRDPASGRPRGLRVAVRATLHRGDRADRADHRRARREDDVLPRARDRGPALRPHVPLPAGDRRSHGHHEASGTARGHVAGGAAAVRVRAHRLRAPAGHLPRSSAGTTSARRRCRTRTTSRCTRRRRSVRSTSRRPMSPRRSRTSYSPRSSSTPSARASSRPRRSCCMALPATARARIASAIREMLRTPIAIPHALDIGGHTVRVFDPRTHEGLIDAPRRRGVGGEAALDGGLRSNAFDRRYVRVQATSGDARQRADPR